MLCVCIDVSIYVTCIWCVSVCCCMCYISVCGLVHVYVVVKNVC